MQNVRISGISMDIGHFPWYFPMSMSFWRMEIQRKTTRNGRNRNVFLNSPSISGGCTFLINQEKQTNSHLLNRIRCSKDSNFMISW